MLADHGASLKRRAALFESTLPHTKRPYASRAWGHPLHSLCSYQGKLKPALAHWLVKEFTAEGGCVLDPLGGVGTIAFEAALLGRSAFTCDLSPLAASVARAKIDPPRPKKLESELDAFGREMSEVVLTAADYDSAEFGLNAKVRDYFHEKTLAEVLRARRLLAHQDLSLERNFIKACLLHVLHGNRPYALSRTSHPITPFNPTGPFEYRPVLDRLRVRCQRLMSLDLPDQFVRGTAWHADFRTLTARLKRPVNAIICSPPFPGMRFDRPNWLRMWLCGWDEHDFHFTSRKFLERQQGKDFEVYADFFALCSDVTAPGSPIIIHVGGSKSYNMVDKLKSIGSRYLRYASTIVENVSHVEKHGLTDKGVTSAHLILVFQRV